MRYYSLDIPWLRLLCLPSHREVGTCCFTSVRSVCTFSPIHFCKQFLSCRRSNMRRWPNAGLMVAHRLRRWANISPVLGHRVVFGATLNVGQRHRRRANINPALVQSIVSVPPTCRYRSKKYWLGLNGYWPAWATLAHHLTDIGSCRLVIAASSKQYQISCYPQQTQNICITFV